MTIEGKDRRVIEKYGYKSKNILHINMNMHIQEMHP